MPASGRVCQHAARARLQSGGHPKPHPMGALVAPGLKLDQRNAKRGAPRPAAPRHGKRDMAGKLGLSGFRHKLQCLSKLPYHVSPNNCLPAVMPKSLCLKCHALLGKGLQSQLFQAFGDKTLPNASARDVTPRPRNLNLPQHPDGQSNCKDIRKVHMATQHTKQSA